MIEARHWWAVLREGELTITDPAQGEGVMPAYMTRVLRLAVPLARGCAALVRGRLRAEVSATTLTATGAVPACWREQAKAMLPGQR